MYFPLLLIRSGKFLRSKVELDEKIVFAWEVTSGKLKNWIES